MSSTALTTATRSALRLMVESETHRLGSKMVAYEQVARTIGASSSWLRQYLANTGAVGEPRISLFQNIKTAYDKICERVEADNRAAELRLATLRGTLDEVTAGFDKERHFKDRDTAKE